MNRFLSPLSLERETECLKKVAQNDKEANDELILHNMRLVAHVTKKYAVSEDEMEELISIGTIGLIKAVSSFKADYGNRFATFAIRCIENEILMYLRRTSKMKMEISFDEPLNVDWDGNELLLSDILGTEDDIIYKDMEVEVEKKLLKRAIDKLSPRERNIIELRYGLTPGCRENTQKEVADQINISQSYISRLEKKIMKRLKKEINRYE